MEEKKRFLLYYAKAFRWKLKWEMYTCFPMQDFNAGTLFFFVTVSLRLLIMNPDVLTQWEPPSLFTHLEHLMAIVNGMDWSLVPIL